MIFRTPVVAFERADYEVLILNQVPNLSGLAMQEFRSKLYGDWKTLVSDCVDATADSIARLQDRDVQTSFCQPACSGQSGQTGANHQNGLHGGRLLTF